MGPWVCKTQCTCCIHDPSPSFTCDPSRVMTRTHFKNRNGSERFRFYSFWALKTTANQCYLDRSCHRSAGNETDLNPRRRVKEVKRTPSPPCLWGPRLMTMPRSWVSTPAHRHPKRPKRWIWGSILLSKFEGTILDSDDNESDSKSKWSINGGDASRQQASRSVSVSGWELGHSQISICFVTKPDSCRNA